MKYLTIIPDYTGSCIRDDFNGEINIEELDLPCDFVNHLYNWHNSYKFIIPLNLDERKTHKDKIEQLDKEGIVLAKQLSKLIKGGAKVKYFSEGLMKYLLV